MLVCALALGGIVSVATPAHADPVPSTASTSTHIDAAFSVTTTTYDVASPLNLLSGTATPGAGVGVQIAGRWYDAHAGDDGSWTISNVVGLVQPSTEGTAYEIVGDETNRITFTLASSTAASAPAAPVVSTTGFDADAVVISISGTAEPRALVALTIDGGEYTATADADGAWSVDKILRPGTAVSTGTVSQISRGQVSATATFTIRARGGDSIGPATITTTEYSRAAPFNPVSGIGEPGALVGLTVGGISYDARVAADGTWTVPRVGSLVLSTQVATVFQANDSFASEKTSFTLHADVPIADVDVANPANPAVGYQPNQPFTFRGTADTLADTVTIRNASGVPVATVPVDHKTGSWSWSRSNMGTSIWKLTFISNEGQPDEEKATLADFKPAATAPAVRPIAFTNPANPAAGYVADTAFTFRGTATPGAKITLQNDKGTVFATGITAAADGTWSWTRANLGTSIWKITAIADAGTSSERKATLGNFAPQK